MHDNVFRFFPYAQLIIITHSLGDAAMFIQRPLYPELHQYDPAVTLSNPANPAFLISTALRLSQVPGDTIL